MLVYWDRLLVVFVVSLSATVAVVVLVSLALLGLSARAVRAVRPDAPPRHPFVSPTAGTALAAVCLAIAAAIVLFGLLVIVTG